MYELWLKQIRGLFGGEKDFFANAANLSAFLYENMENINWVGFYMMEPDELVLGPFMGKPACIRIAPGKGVCGTAVENREIQLVPDVHKFPGHIACDSASNSEIVIPLVNDGKVLGVLDIDSPILSRFSSDDAEGLKKITEILLDSSDMDRVSSYYSKS